LFGELFDIYRTFFGIGAVTFGGGYAMLPILRREVVQSKSWVTEEEIMDYYALSQGLPGIIASNVAAFIGYRRRGTAGSLAASLGVISPSILIITVIALLLAGFQDNPYVRHALSAVSVCVVALILDAVLSLWKKGVKDALGLAIFAAVLLVSVFTKVSPVLLIVACAAIGVSVRAAQRAHAAKGAEK